MRVTAAARRHGGSIDPCWPWQLVQGRGFGERPGMNVLAKALLDDPARQEGLSRDEPGIWDLVFYTRPIQPGCELENLKGVKNAA
nr:hypothetical protein 11 [bacterium]